MQSERRTNDHFVSVFCLACFCFFRLFVFGGITLFIPSICSNNCGSTLAFIGSRMKSTPSRRASFAAGTKSASPEKRTIVSTKRFKDNEAMSTPIFISMLFCLMFKYTSFSVKSSTLEYCCCLRVSAPWCTSHAQPLLRTCHLPYCIRH